jgi:hypothetical protein
MAHRMWSLSLKQKSGNLALDTSVSVADGYETQDNLLFASALDLLAERVGSSPF